MTASGAQDQLEKNPGYYQSLLGAQHDPKLVETICTGQAVNCFLLTLVLTQSSHTHQVNLKELAFVKTYSLLLYVALEPLSNPSMLEIQFHHHGLTNNYFHATENQNTE